MDQLIFFAIIILFTILESIARSRKAKKGGGMETGRGPRPDPGGWEARLPELELPKEELPTYDEEPSYDEVATRRRQKREDKTLERYTRPYGSEQPAQGGGARPSPQRPSSETMLPGDLLEQLEGLARGRQAERRKARPRDLPGQSPPRPPLERTEVGTGPGASTPVGSKGPVGSTAPIGSRTPIAKTGEHRVHLSHAEYGTDPSKRARSEQEGLDPLREGLGPEATAVRRQLLRGGRSGLREAIVLKEILGAPLALRDQNGWG